MVKFGGITEWVANRVAEIVGPQSKDGQVYTAEVRNNKLAELLANTDKPEDKKYIMGFMIEREGQKNITPPKNDYEEIPVEGDHKPGTEIRRFHHDDGTYYDEISVPGEGCTYVSYDKDGKLLKKDFHVLIDGCEYPDHQEIYHDDGSVEIIDKSEGRPEPKETRKNLVEDKTDVKTEVKEKNDNSEFTPKEIKEARDAGKSLVDRLQGHTNKDEQLIVQKTIEHEVNSENVLEFLRGYNKKAKEISMMDVALGFGLIKMQNGFFVQMVTEWSFPEKQELVRKVATDLKEYVQSRYGENSPLAKEIAVVLEEPKFNKENAKILDGFVKRLMAEQMN